ncbi:MAG: hypothetical protein LRY73_07310 [Bacillus sp. (in: Bacteria)]|nr:hypothetical protein [Bacillus sp. (in: firmicutes)]
MYNKVVEACIKNANYYELFRERLDHIAEMASGIGWGYGDTLAESYFTLRGYYEEEEELE